MRESASTRAFAGGERGATRLSVAGARGEPEDHRQGMLRWSQQQHAIAIRDNGLRGGDGSEGEPHAPRHCLPHAARADAPLPYRLLAVAATRRGPGPRVQAPAGQGKRRSVFLPRAGSRTRAHRAGMITYSTSTTSKMASDGLDAFVVCAALPPGVARRRGGFARGGVRRASCVA
jgi:hypothetical protein